MTQITPQMATDFVHQVVPAIGRLGVTVEAVAPGSVTLRVPIEGNANHMGTMYAGALFALAELLADCCHWARSTRPSTSRSSRRSNCTSRPRPAPT